MAIVEFPNHKIQPSLIGDVVARADRDVHGAAADLMLLAVELQTVDQVLSVQRKVLAMRAALDAVASFLLDRGEQITR